MTERIKFPLVEFGRCGGSVSVEVSAENEPIFGGTQAQLEVHFKCDRCKTEVCDNRLPDEFKFNKWLTEIMKTWEPE